MYGYSGFIFIFTELQRRENIKEYLESGSLDHFTDAVSGADWKPKETEICFISFDGNNIHYAALARRGRKVVTGKYSLKFSNFIDLLPISFKDIESAIENRLQQYFIYSASGNGGRVPTKTWIALLNVIKRLRPECADQLDLLDKKRRLTQRTFNTSPYEVVAQEKDAIGLALDVFQGEQKRRKVLSSWFDTDDENIPPYLRGIKKSQLREDTMINHDANVIDNDWETIARHRVGVVTFAKRGERLTVHNVNRTPIERTLGVDLLYYNWKYDSWVMVQYKRMAQEKGDLVYRPNDSSYKSELQSMIAFQKKFVNQPEIKLIDYRLHQGAFYFKLCPSIIFNPLSDSLLTGMYLPLDYWQLLIDSKEGHGPRGGIAVGYDNVGRYLNNKQFIDLVRSGWVGARLNYSSSISNLVRNWIEHVEDQHHSAILAISEKVD